MPRPVTINLHVDVPKLVLGLVLVFAFSLPVQAAYTPTLDASAITSGNLAAGVMPTTYNQISSQAAPTISTNYNIGTRSNPTLTSGENGQILGESKANPASSSSAVFDGVWGYSYVANTCAQNLTAAVGVAGVTGMTADNGSGTITGMADFYAKASGGNTGGGTITNLYGLYVAALGAGTNHYGVYVVSDPSHFGGAVDSSSTVTGTAIIAGASKWSSGSGSPNSVVTGSPGDLYTNTAGGTSTTLYVKESGTGTNTGWVAK